jgi:methylenetetrahydrofolate reductase (NADPH)
LVADPTFEVLPLKSASDLLPLLPAGARVSVTASPSRGLDATIAFSETLAAAGFRALPHLAAHLVRDRAHLAGTLDRLQAAGIDAAFVAGGDADQIGPYADALSLLREMAELPWRPAEIGIGAYPQGHPTIPAPSLAAALAAKAPYATFMTTQLCFNVPALTAWLAARRAEGLVLPAVIGVPGAVEVHRLLRISARVGVTDASRYVRKNLPLVGRLLRPAGYRPDRLLAELAPVLGDPAMGVSGLHLYSFNEIASIESWRGPYLHALRS